MEKTVLLIGDAKSFMVSSIEKGLARNSFTVTLEKPDVTKVSRLGLLPEIVLLYLEQELPEDFLIYLRDMLKMSDREILFYPIGSDDELSRLYEIVPEVLTTGTFKRPLNVNVLVDTLKETLEKQTFIENRRKILVVDDDANMLQTIKFWLSSRYRVFIANSGMSAITFLARNSVDLVLLDYEMPVANGPTVLEMIRSEPATRHIPVMFLTAKNDMDSVMTGVSLKPEKYILKNISSQQLIMSIEDYFEQHRPEEK